ncbi:MAG: zinc-ribbon domain-containing protein [Treponema sp.]|nr:zinc-ribbon domain-containing protein [Treponema sp.]
MEEYQGQQYEEFKQQSEEEKKVSKQCPKCGAELDDDMVFCPGCGEKIGGEEKECPDCKTMTSADYCPNCGYKMTPSYCPNCGAETHYPFCANCGTPVDADFAQAVAEQEKLREETEKAPEPRMMTEEEKKQFEEEVENSVSDEIAYFLKKKEEYKILKRERDYFNAREKRIVKVLGKNSVSLRLPDPDELAYSAKIYNQLKRTMVAKREKAEREELERLFPDIYKAQQDEKIREQQIKEREEAIKKELELKQKELNEKRRNFLANLSKEIGDSVAAEKERRKFEEEIAREEERLREEAEEKRRREEEERKRREREYQRKLEEQRRNRFLGIWVSAWSNNSFIKITAKSGEKVRGLSDGLNHEMSNTSGYFSGVIKGNSINLVFERYTKRDAGWTHCDTFFGNFTPDGNIRGGWTNNSAEYYGIWYKF